MVVTPKPSPSRPTGPPIMSAFQSEFSEGYEVLLPKGPTTVHQEALAIFWISLTVFWIYLYVYQKLRWFSWSPTKSLSVKEGIDCVSFLSSFIDFLLHVFFISIVFFNQRLEYA